MNEDVVFRALADPTRRALLDALFHDDGQTLTALEARFPMSRFGVMKHLRLLEEAGLVVAHRQGREKRHFLNAVPIQLIHERWVSKYAQPWAATLTGLKAELESRRTPVADDATRAEPPGRPPRTAEVTMEKVYEIYIKTTPERLWEAITDPETRAKYNFGARLRTDWSPGSRVELWAPGAPSLLGEGEIVEVDPPKRLVHTMHALWGEDVQAEGPSRITWQIEQVGDSCRLLLTHDQLREGANEQLFGGWPMILSGLKTWLETGQLLTTPGSLMYASTN